MLYIINVCSLFIQYLISKSELENRTLWVTVWHNDRFGRNDFLGEVTINFDYFRFGESSAKWYPLQERVSLVRDLDHWVDSNCYVQVIFITVLW